MSNPPYDPGTPPTEPGPPGYPPPPSQYPPPPPQYPPPGYPPPYQQDYVPYSPYGYQPYAPPPMHPQANTVMVLGIVAVAGGAVCWLPVVVAPFAWAMGKRVMSEIDASGGTMGGRGQAQAGYILGIIGTVLLGLALIGVILWFILFGAVIASGS